MLNCFVCLCTHIFQRVVQRLLPHQRAECPCPCLKKENVAVQLHRANRGLELYGLLEICSAPLLFIALTNPLVRITHPHCHTESALQALKRGCSSALTKARNGAFRWRQNISTHFQHTDVNIHWEAAWYTRYMFFSPPSEFLKVTELSTFLLLTQPSADVPISQQCTSQACAVRASLLCGALLHCSSRLYSL